MLVLINSRGFGVFLLQEEDLFRIDSDVRGRGDVQAANSAALSVRFSVPTIGLMNHLNSFIC